MHNTGIMHRFIHQAADTYVDQLQSCRPEILYPQLVHDTPKTEILKNILFVPVPRSKGRDQDQDEDHQAA